MPLLIDGNNLLHALGKAGLNAGRGGLVRLLDGFAARRERVVVVFDGPRRAPPAGADEPDRVEVHYSGRRSADEIIAEHIAASTAPRRLTVVSTDRQIRKAARRRRCKVQVSEDFARALIRAAERPRRPPPVEPPEKRHGLTAEQTKAWLREFQLDTEQDDPGDELP